MTQRLESLRPWMGSVVPAVGGALIALSLPPWDLGTAALGLALWFLSLRGADARSRALRSTVVAVAWFVPSTVWMIGLTAAGWPVVIVLWGALYAGAGALVPGDDRARWVFPAAITLAELIRWTVPFGGVPIATIAIAEVDLGWRVVARWLGSPGLVLATAVLGVALAEAIRVFWAGAWRERTKWIPAGVAAAVWATLVVVGIVAPGASDQTPLSVAVVQGGGEQNTRADRCENRNVFERHMAASATIDRDVDLIVWPENVVNPAPDGEATPQRCEQPLLWRSEADGRLAGLAVDNSAVVVSGWFERSPDDTANVNYAQVHEPAGTRGDRYDKVQLVPFGEFVPMRGLIEAFSDELPARDVRPGIEPAVLETSLGPLGVAISWEIFFDHRARDAIGNGGEVLLNPTNGSSYWLTIVQSQQVASSRLRAVETDRWVLQAAPTGFSAIITPDAAVVERTEISEGRVIYADIARREGTTLAVRWGAWPALIASLAALVVAWAPDLRTRVAARLG